MEVIELWPFSQGEINGGPDQFVDAAFRQRRKTLRAALSGWAGSAPEAERLLRAAGLDPGARGESLDIAEFARLAASRLSTPPATPRTI